METIKTIEQLAHNLNLGPGYGGYDELIKAVDLSSEELQKVQRFSDEQYQRLRLYDTDVIEAVLTCWNPTQVGKIHNFHHSLGWFKVLQGSLALERFSFDEEGLPVSKLSREIKEGEWGFLNDDLGFHRFENKGPQKAITLFLYADKIKDWDVYNPTTQRVERIPASVHHNFDPEE